MHFSPALLLAAPGLFWIGVAVVLAVVCWSVFGIIRNRRRGASAARTHAAPDADTRPAPAEEESEDLVAVLTAAAHAALKRQVVVKSFTFLSNEEHPMWSVTGRINIMASHLISKRKP